MKLIYLATGNIAVETLQALIEKHEVLAVVTQPDKPQGRANRFFPSPVAVSAENKGIKIFKPEKINIDLINELKSLDADLFITFSYGEILKEDFFNISRLGGVNIHPSMLPELRGPSPIKTAILKGFTSSGITIQKMKLEVDCGDILFQEAFEIQQEDDALSVEKKVSALSARMINVFLEKFTGGKIIPQQQDNSKATYCKLIKKAHGLISWNDNGADIINKIRAFVEWPVCYGFIDKVRINIYKARINNELTFSDYMEEPDGKIIFADKKNGIVVKSRDCLINVLILQQNGKKVLEWKDFINGYKDLKTKKFELE